VTEQMASRGITGAYHLSMPVDVTTEIDIDRLRSEVARYVSDPDNTTECYENIKSVRW
jgi:hypothetical protein